MYGIFRPQFGLNLFMIHVGKYSIHGSKGLYIGYADIWCIYNIYPPPPPTPTINPRFLKTSRSFYTDPAGGALNGPCFFWALTLPKFYHQVWHIAGSRWSIAKEALTLNHANTCKSPHQPGDREISESSSAYWRWQADRKDSIQPLSVDRGS